MNLTYGVGSACAGDGKGGNIKKRSHAVVVISKPQKLATVRSGVTPDPRQVGLDKTHIERIMPGGHRSVGCKDRGATYFVERCIEAFASVHQLTHSLERYECC